MELGLLAKSLTMAMNDASFVSGAVRGSLLTRSTRFGPNNCANNCSNHQVAMSDRYKRETETETETERVCVCGVAGLHTRLLCHALFEVLKTLFQPSISGTVFETSGIGLSCFVKVSIASICCSKTRIAL
jgi:hypothetical protein